MKSDDWKYMKDFALEIITHAKVHNTPKIFDQRMAIIHLDHANELLMKAYLIKEGYTINIINAKNLVGIKENEKISKFLNKNRTIDYVDALDFISKKLNFSKEHTKLIRDFHIKRNEIQHRAMEIHYNKGEVIRQMYPHLKELYDLMFPENKTEFPNITN